MLSTFTTPSALDSFPPSVADAWADSFLSQFPPAAADALAEGCYLDHIGAKDVFYRAGSCDPHPAPFALVVGGLLRFYMKAADDRQVTLRYAAPGTVVGIPLRAPLPGLYQTGLGGSREGEAVRDSVILHMSADRFLELAREDADVAWLLSLYIIEQMDESQRSLAADVLHHVTSRVAYHLLTLAEREDGVLRVRASYQELANAAGSVREVVSRAVKRLEAEHLLEREAGGFVLIDPSALHRVSNGELRVRLTEAA